MYMVYLYFVNEILAIIFFCNNNLSVLYPQSSCPCKSVVINEILEIKATSLSTSLAWHFNHTIISQKTKYYKNILDTSYFRDNIVILKIVFFFLQKCLRKIRALKSLRRSCENTTTENIIFVYDSKWPNNDLSHNFQGLRQNIKHRTNVHYCIA